MIQGLHKPFSAVEDIHYLMNIPKRAPHPQKLAEFYSKLGVVFSRSKMDLFHACTQDCFRHFSLEKYRGSHIRLYHLAIG